MIRKIYILLFLIFFISSNSYSKSPPPGTGTSNVPANILIMLDNSGSMGWTTTNVNTTSYPVSVGVDSKGNVYSVEYQYHRIKKFKEIFLI